MDRRVRVKKFDENSIIESASQQSLKSVLGGHEPTKRSANHSLKKPGDTKRVVLRPVSSESFHNTVNRTSSTTTNNVALKQNNNNKSIQVYKEYESDGDETVETRSSDDEKHAQYDYHQQPIMPNSDDTIEQDDDDDDDEDAKVIDADVDIDNDEDEELASAEHSPSLTNPNALYPVHDHTSRQILNRLKVEYANKSGIWDDEDEDTLDVSMVAEYSDEIYWYMRKLEQTMLPDAGYMDNQTEIHWSMRSILVDWLVQVHARFNLLPETLYLTVNYMDRFLSLKTVSLSKFQLVGAVALFLAAKYEEINCPSVNEIAYMVDKGYTVDEILKAERYMVDLLEYNLGWPGPMSFLRRTSKADDYDLETRTLAKYLLEITIMDERFIGSPPSWLAATAHCLARKMLNRGEWSTDHVYFGGYTEHQLQPAIDVFLECCKNPMEHHKAIYEKYSERKFKRASLFVANWMKEEF